MIFMPWDRLRKKEKPMSDLRERVEALAEFFQQQGEPLDGGWVALQLRALLAPREEEPEGEPRADVSDALWCMECGYRRGTSSGQTRTKCPHGHGELVRARLLTLEQFSKIVPGPAPAANTEGLRRYVVRRVSDGLYSCVGTRSAPDVTLASLFADDDAWPTLQLTTSRMSCRFLCPSHF